MPISHAPASPIRSTTACEQGLVVEAAFGQVVVGAGFEAAPPVFLAVLVGDDHHRQRLQIADPCLISVTSSMPSMRGMSMSVTTRSKWPVRTAFQPSMPSTATSTS